MGVSVRLPTATAAVAATLAFFGLRAVALMLMFIFAVMAREGLSMLNKYAMYGFEVQADLVETGLVLGAFLIGLGLYVAFKREIPFNVPRGLSMSVVLLITAAVFCIVAFTDLRPVIEWMWNFTYKALTEPLFKVLGEGLISMIAIYMLLVPRFLSFMRRVRIHMFYAGLVVSVFTLFISWLSLSIVLQTLSEVQAKISGFMFLVFGGVVGLVAFLELRRIVQTAPIDLLTQLPAIIVIASLGIGLFGPEYAKWLSWMCLAIYVIMCIGFLIGLATENRSAFLNSCVIASSLSMVAIGIERVTSTITAGMMF